MNDRHGIMSDYRIPPGDIVTRGEEIYKQIRDHVAPGNHGRFVVIDVETGKYELDEDDAVATMRVLAKNPGTMTYGIRIGFPVAYRLGARL